MSWHLSRHCSIDVLASFAAGDLKPRKAARVTAHLRVCGECSGQIRELERVPSLLAAVQLPPIPDYLFVRIEMAIATESAARVASQPASEAGRRDVPARARQPRRRLSGLTTPAGLRTVAAVGAAVIVAGGGYEIATHVGSAPSSSSSAAEHSPAAPAGAVSAGPQVTYTHAGHTDAINAIHSGTNFRRATLRAQTAAALVAFSAEQGPAHELAPLGAAGGAPASGKVATNTTAVPSVSPSKLEGCVGRIAAGRTVRLVDIAKYEDASATIIVVSGQNGGPSTIYAVGSNCSGTTSDILAQQQLKT
jgi:hypothetical protein